jgi:biotin carboxyl carrier protein
VNETILVNRQPLLTRLDPTLVDVIHHHESGPTHLLVFFHEGRPYQASVVQRGNQYYVVIDGQSFVVSFERVAPQAAAAEEEARVVRAPMDCRLIALYKGAGEAVRPGEAIGRIESMKLESNLTAGADGILAELHVRPGDSLREGQVVAVLGERSPQ